MWAGALARMILLSGAEPTGLSPGCSHSRPARENQPSGLRRSAVRSARQVEVSFCQEVSCEVASAGSNPNRNTMKARQAERSLKRMRKYNVEEKELKMKGRKIALARHCGRSSGSEDRGITGGSGSRRNIHSWHRYFQLSTRSGAQTV